jgi:hypothetical protein
VPLRAEDLHKLATYWAKHLDRMSGIADPRDVNEDVLRNMRDMKVWVEDHMPKNDAPTIEDKDWVKATTIKNKKIDEFLKSCLGIEKIPLDYIIRPDAKVMPEVEDALGSYQTGQARATHMIG